MGANARHGKAFGQMGADRCFDTLAQTGAGFQELRPVRRGNAFARRREQEDALRFSQHGLAKSIDEALRSSTSSTSWGRADKRGYPVIIPERATRKPNLKPQYWSCLAAQKPSSAQGLKQRSRRLRVYPQTGKGSVSGG